MQILFFIIAIAIGHFFAFVEGQPNFDDTGVLVLAIVITSAIFASVFPRRPWLWALAVGIWIPLHNLIHNGGLVSAVALLFALAGAYLGAWLRRSFAHAS